ncbi:MAG: endonuclease MutS2 [Anaerorhabdus sp.]|uniref:endonuclease MutS2 n=1 Tax=Anaerorhabdus sp. TaxID=1872524 RepID=UPI002FC94280
MSTAGIELEVIKNQIANLCAFSLGQQKILSLEPSFSPLLLRRENKRIKEALACTIKYSAMPLTGLKDITLLLEQAKKGMTLTPLDFVQTMNHIRATRGIVSYTKGIEEECEELQDLVSSLVIFKEVQDKLESCFSDDGEILDTASDTLRGIRKALLKIDGEIQTETNRFMQKHASSMIDNIVTTRNNRVVVLVKAGDKNSFGGFIHGESASGQTAYVEPSSFVEINNRKQSLLYQEQEEMERICWECSEVVSNIAEDCLNNLETCAILDALFAKASWGKKEDACVAQLTQEKSIYLKNTRHPLIDRKKVVENTYRIIEPVRVLLITGPNTGGKTVSLKCLGLAVLLTYCGIPVCAEEAQIPFFDHVFIDIGDDQSVLQSLSTFSAHLSKLADVSQHATKDSFVLLDELGSGTDPKEGESLAIAILNDLRDKGCLVVATTHYGRLKAYGKRHEDILVSSVQFDVEKLVPTYHFVEGLTGQSNAFEIARRYNLKESIIKSAEFLKNQQKTEEDRLIEKLELQVLENQQLKEKLVEQQTIQNKMFKELQNEKEVFERNKEKNIEKAKQEAEDYLHMVKEEAQAILDEMRKKQETEKYHEVLDVKKKLTLLDEEEEEEIEEKEFKVGDTIEIRQSHQIAKIIQVNKNQITLDLNGITVKSTKDKIKHTHKVITKPKKVFSMRTEKIQSFKLECNLIGLRVEEALPVLQKYMDDAKFNHMATVRIIHGDGTGALRKAVHEYLKSDRDVVNYRLGAPNEGSTGATVVTLRG